MQTTKQLVEQHCRLWAETLGLQIRPSNSGGFSIVGLPGTNLNVAMEQNYVKFSLPLTHRLRTVDIVSLHRYSSDRGLALTDRARLQAAIPSDGVAESHIANVLSHLTESESGVAPAAPGKLDVAKIVNVLSVHFNSSVRVGFEAACAKFQAANRVIMTAECRQFGIKIACPVYDDGAAIVAKQSCLPALALFLCALNGDAQIGGFGLADNAVQFAAFLPHPLSTAHLEATLTCLRSRQNAVTRIIRKIATDERFAHWWLCLNRHTFTTELGFALSRDCA